MTEGQIVALVWGPFAMIFGTCFFFFRNQISRLARAQRVRRGYAIGPHTQSPLLMAAGGLSLVIVGALVAAGGATGILR
ncbi:hypothetical protein GCM10022239_23710 [Leifsonia bigeumensis]|uniref:Uncharacterized protein n=1 Tax=Leifsonella bigeumensis TaxID=433643 RepID=A0ABP7FW86_9MICO